MIDSFLKYLEYEKRFSKHTLTSYKTDLSQFSIYLQILGEIEPEKAKQKNNNNKNKKEDENNYV